MEKIRVLFIHHSTGGLLLRFGKIRKILSEKTSNIELWDHAYNLYPVPYVSNIVGPITFRTGLSDSKGRLTGTDFNIVISNNSPKEYADIFGRNKNDSTLSKILEFDVVMFKNCFPTSKIETEEKLDEYKKLYGKIINDISQYKNVFVIFTPPPLRREMTNPIYAKHARNLADWLESQHHVKKNVAVFDFFDTLADKEGNNKNMLKRNYCNLIPVDSHPNIKANREVGKIFVDWLIEEINNLYNKKLNK